MRVRGVSWTRAFRMVLAAIFGALVGFGVFVAVDVAIAGHQMGLAHGQEAAPQVREHLLPQSLLPLAMFVGAVVGAWLARVGKRG
ncbi:hypothetical protein LLH23_22490 [bacterium]|nr:hypothetical protein [bacterium]